MLYVQTMPCHNLTAMYSRYQHNRLSSIVTVKHIRINIFSSTTATFKHLSLKKVVS